MKIVQKHARLTQVKNGNKIVFEIMHSRCQTRFHSFQHGLDVVLDCKSIEECIERTFAKIDYLNAELVKRMISL